MHHTLSGAFVPIYLRSTSPAKTIVIARHMTRKSWSWTGLMVWMRRSSSKGSSSSLSKSSLNSHRRTIIIDPPTPLTFPRIFIIPVRASCLHFLILPRFPSLVFPHILRVEPLALHSVSSFAYVFRICPSKAM